MDKVEIKRGDLVLVKKSKNPARYDFSDGFNNIFVKQMIPSMGNKFRVRDIDPSGIQLYDGIGEYAYPPQMIKLIESAQQETDKDAS